MYDSGELSVVRQFVVAIGNVNYRPKDIKFSDVTQGSVKENQENAFVASLVTIDDDQSDKHTYELIGSANNRFTIDGNTLTTIASLDYEDESEHTVVIRSIDSGFPPLYVDKNFTIHVTDVNEAPSAVMVKDNDVKENSEIGTLVGKLHADDPDNARTTRQVVTFTMTDSASGRFMIEGDVVVVAISNQRCLAFGGAECKINYETAKWHNITIRAEDDGTPRLGRTFNLTIYVTDVNDQPRNLEIDAYQVEENETADTLVGSFLATDEDEGDVLSYTLLDDDEGQFKVNGSDLLKARGTDYETRKSHAITVEVTDSKEPVKSVSFVYLFAFITPFNYVQMNATFIIEVLNVNEPPVAIYFKDRGGQLSFQDNYPRVEENSAMNTVVGIVEGLDEDAGQILTFSLDNVDGRFGVEASTCRATNSIDVSPFRSTIKFV